MQLELEAGDDAEVAAAAPDGPKQLRILVRRGSQDPAVGDDNLRRNEVVDSQAELAGKPTHAATQGQPTHTGVADKTGGCCQPVSLGGGVHVGQQCTATDSGASARRINGDLTKLTQVDHEPGVVDRGPRHVVCPTTYGDLEPLLPRKDDCCADICCVQAAGDHGRVAVDLGVPHHPRSVVGAVRRHDHLSGERLAEVIES